VPYYERLVLVNRGGFIPATSWNMGEIVHLITNKSLKPSISRLSFVGT